MFQLSARFPPRLTRRISPVSQSFCRCASSGVLIDPLDRIAERTCSFNSKVNFLLHNGWIATDYVN